MHQNKIGCFINAYLQEATRFKAQVWGSSKGRIIRINVPQARAAARVLVCHAKAQWDLYPSHPADHREGRLYLRS